MVNACTFTVDQKPRMTRNLQGINQGVHPEINLQGEIVFTVTNQTTLEEIVLKEKHNLRSPKTKEK